MKARREEKVQREKRKIDRICLNCRNNSHPICSICQRCVDASHFVVLEEMDLNGDE